jgi:hypothetical protein
MCSMALLHSRFGRVVFGRDMDKTGGLKAEKQNNTTNTIVQSLQDATADKENSTTPSRKKRSRNRPPPVNTALANSAANSGPMSPPIRGKPDQIGYGLFWRPQLNWKFLCWQWDKAESVPKDAASKVLTSGEEFDDVSDLQVHLDALSLVHEAQMDLPDTVHA